MTFAQKLDYEPAGLISLTPAFWGKPRMTCILVTLLEAVQEVEDAVWSVVDRLDVDTAPYVVLDWIAKWVGEPARPESADALRTLVKGRILANRSSGTLSDLHELCATFSDPQFAFETTLDVALFITPSGAVDPDFAVQLVDDAAMGTVNTALITVGTFGLYDYDTPSVTYPGWDEGTFGDRHGLA